MIERKLTPELLDELPPDDPAAMRSRKDLAFINGVMGNYRWIASRMDRPGTWLEIGAGTGSLARHFSRRESVRVKGVDLAPRPGIWPNAWEWHQGDLFEFFDNEVGEVEGVVANLFLHHFTDEQLRRLGSLISSSAGRLLFSEPARYELHRAQGRMGFPFFNPVTRHDMMVSIEAGFREDELASILGLDSDEWSWKVTRTFWGAYRLEANRNIADEATISFS